MIVKNILNDIEVVSKENIRQSFDELSINSEVSCVGVSCIDLLGNNYLVEKLGLTGSRFLLLYLFHNLNNEKLSVIGCPLLYGQTMHSFSNIWSSLYYHEKEIEQNFQITFYLNERIQNEILAKTTKGFLEKDYSSNEKNGVVDFSNSEYDKLEVTLDEMGISYDRTKFQFLVNGRNIFKFQVAQDGAFMGLEKKFEALKIDDISKYISHVNIETPFTYQLLWKEVCLYIKSENRSVYADARMMLLKEVSSITEHLNSLINCFSLLNENHSKSICRSMKFDLFELLKELNDLRPYPLIAQEFQESFPKGWIRSCISIIQKYEDNIKSLRDSITSMERYVSELNKGPSLSNPLKTGLNGLMLRSFGVSYDIRKNRPFYFYDQLDLKVPLGVVGSSYDRILIRLEEALESMSNVIRICEGFPVYKKETSYSVNQEHQKEELIFASAESANGEVVMIVHYDFEKQQVCRVNVITPSSRFLKYFEGMYSQSDLDLISVDWSSYGLNISEVIK